MSILSASKVEWMQGGKVCNPITGCLRRCQWCWAWDQTRRWPDRYLANIDGIICPDYYPEPYDDAGNDPFWPRWWPEPLEAVRRLRKPTKIWMVNMGDAFGSWVPDWMIKEMLQVARDCPQHQFLWLTKFPERLPEFNPWLANCLVGATATDFQTFLAACFELEKAEAPIKFLSMEPLLDWPDNHRYADLVQRFLTESNAALLRVAGISWVITGPCNGRLARQYPCQAEWLGGIADVCTLAGVPLFEKCECGRLITDRELRKEFPKEVNNVC